MCILNFVIFFIAMLSYATINHRELKTKWLWSPCISHSNVWSKATEGICVVMHLASASESQIIFALVLKRVSTSSVIRSEGILPLTKCVVQLRRKTSVKSDVFPMLSPPTPAFHSTPDSNHPLFTVSKAPPKKVHTNTQRVEANTAACVDVLGAPSGRGVDVDVRLHFKRGHLSTVLSTVS